MVSFWSGSSFQSVVARQSLGAFFFFLQEISRSSRGCHGSRAVVDTYHGTTMFPVLKQSQTFFFCHSPEKTVFSLPNLTTALWTFLSSDSHHNVERTLLAYRLLYTELIFSQLELWPNNTQKTNSCLNIQLLGFLYMFFLVHLFCS